MFNIEIIKIPNVSYNIRIILNNIRKITWNSH